VREGPRLPRTQCDVLSVSAALVIRVHEQLRQLANGAPGTGHVAGDSRGDPVAMLSQTLPVLTPYDLAVTIEPAVAARCVAAGEVAEKGEISGGPREPGESQW
ncbi:hypothetical protein, partial [Streptomyces umbrinus]|uniref:hypothetical protein n=1 Tax=Streptomyces umbrinus TaxID=67370 RepID=UPI0033F23540